MAIAGSLPATGRQYTRPFQVREDAVSVEFQFVDVAAQASVTADFASAVSHFRLEIASRISQRLTLLGCIAAAHLCIDAGNLRFDLGPAL